MNEKILLVGILLVFFTILEATIIQLPLTLLLLLVITIFYRSEWSFIFAIAIGIILDSLLFRPIGETSLFFCVFLFLVFLYEQKFELKTPAFGVFMSLFGSLFYFLLFGYQVLLLQL